MPERVALPYGEMQNYGFTSMRAVSFSMIVYILMLLSQPCQDVFAAAPSHEGGSTAAVASPQTYEGEHAEFCSPFCICSCCGLNVGYHALVTIAEPTHHAAACRKIVPAYHRPAVKNIADSIWQPPKL